MSQKVLEARNISKTYKGEIEVKALKLSTLPTLDFYNSTKLINELTEAMDIIIMKNRDRQDNETISRLTQKEQSIN